MKDRAAVYARQTLMPQIGMQGQERLQKSHVALVGAGGLGLPALTYLASAGVGKISIYDNDVVHESNLNRQFFYSLADIGTYKATLVAEKMLQHFPQVLCHSSTEKITEHTVATALSGADCILLCVDNFTARHVVNAYAMKQGVFLVDGGVQGFYGTLQTVYAKDTEAPCLACSQMQALQQEKLALNPAPIAALGATCGVIASLQASVCLMHLLGMDNPYKSTLVHYDGIRGEMEKIPLQRHTSCPWHD